MADDLVEAKNFSDYALIRIFAIYFQRVRTNGERILIEYIIERTHISKQLGNINILSWEEILLARFAHHAHITSLIDAITSRYEQEWKWQWPMRLSIDNAKT